MPASPPAPLVGVTIRVDRKSMAQGLDTVLAKLAQCGLSAVESHARFGIVNGRAPVDRLDAMRQIEGVESVREDATYRAGSG